MTTDGSPRLAAFSLTCSRMVRCPMHSVEISNGRDTATSKRRILTPGQQSQVGQASDQTHAMRTFNCQLAFSSPHHPGQTRVVLPDRGSLVRKRAIIPYLWRKCLTLTPVNASTRK